MFLYLDTAHSIAECGNDLGKGCFILGPATATLSYYTSSPQVEAVWASRGHWTMSGDTSGCLNWGGGSYCHLVARSPGCC